MSGSAWFLDFLVVCRRSLRHATAPAPQVPARKSRCRMAVVGRKPEVLVVDDDRGVREALDLGLALEGFTVRLAEDGEEALEQVAGRSPSVIVLDVTMPGLSGVEVVRALR